MNEIKVTFLPINKSVFVFPGTKLLETAGRVGIALQTPCGGRGTCGKCKVRVIDGICPATRTEMQVLGEKSVANGYRLACQCIVEQNVTIDIPLESLFEQEYRILTEDEDSEVLLQPSVRKKYFELEHPAQKNAISDLARLRENLSDVTVPYSMLNRLPSFLRANSWKGTAVISNQHCIALEKGNTRSDIYGIALDIGTTTIAGVLVDLAVKKQIAVVSSMNPQIAFGDDVISRIQYVREHSDGLHELQEVIVEAINFLVKRLIYQASISPLSVYEMVVAGNTTMQQILCGLDPSALGELPFVPVFDTFQRVHAQHIGIGINTGADISVYGQIGGFVGGDTLACMVATRIDSSKEPSLLVDIGTNGEIVLSVGDDIFAASTAAGPAFEGARIGQGMRATLGAIEKVLINEDVSCNVIGNIAPIGICGTGLIDAIAQMLNAGILDITGRIIAREMISADTPIALQERLINNEDGLTDFILVPIGETGSDRPVLIGQKDIREFQLACGAIRAGINILLKRAGLSPDGLNTVFLAGAFGNFIRRSSAMRVGLLPSIEHERIRSVGNASLLGAKMALLSLEEREYAERLRQKTTHVDLSMDAEFQMEFGMAMMFPDNEYTPQL